MWEVYIAIALINSIGVLVYSISSFGNAIIYHLGWHLCKSIDSTICEGGISVVVIHVTLAGFFVFPSQLWHLRKSVNWPLAIHLTITQQLGLYFGLYILFSVDSIWLGRVFGMLFFAVSLHMILVGNLPSEKNTIDLFTDEDFKLASNNSSTNEEEDDNAINNSSTGFRTVHLSTNSIDTILKNDSTDMNYKISAGKNDYLKLDSWNKILLVWCTGLCAGIFGGLFATGGPPMMLFVSVTKISSLECRATQSFCDLFGNSSRILFLLFFQSKIMILENSYFIIFFVLTITSALCLMIGNEIGKSLDQQVFRRILICLLAGGSIFMGVADCTFKQSMIITASCLIILLIAVFIAYNDCCKRLDISNVVESDSNITGSGILIANEGEWRDQNTDHNTKNESYLVFNPFMAAPSKKFSNFSSSSIENKNNSHLDSGLSIEDDTTTVIMNRNNRPFFSLFSSFKFNFHDISNNISNKFMKYKPVNLEEEEFGENVLF